MLKKASGPLFSWKPADRESVAQACVIRFWGVALAGNRTSHNKKKTAAKPATKVESARSRWILGPVPDLTLIVGTPLLIFAAIILLRRTLGPYEFTAFVMIFAIGHHLPGMMRAYGDPALLARFRTRFIVAPILLAALCAYSSVFSKHGVVAVAAVWGWWHYLMQTYGFVRIYDAKVGSFDNVTRLLDQAMCLVWFAAAVILNDNASYSYLMNFYNSGLGIPSAETFDFLRSLVIALAVVVTGLFLANTVRKRARGEPFNPIKILLMILTFAAFWYSTNTVANLLVAYAFFELFHDIQYLTIVWAFNRNRVKKDPTLVGFTRFLFRPRVALIGLYVAMVVGYGSLDYGSKLLNEGQFQNILFGVFLASTLLHYYFDGFIWKIRESDTQKSLEIGSAGSHRLSSFRLVPWLRHSLLWCLFAIPVATLFLTQSQAKQSPREDSQRLVACAPNSMKAHRDAALALELDSDYLGAARHYEKAMLINPSYGDAVMGLVRALEKLGVESMESGNAGDAVQYFQKALKIAPNQPGIRMRLSNAEALADQPK